MNSALYVGNIAHKRHIPKKHRFQYPFFMWFLDLERVDQLPDMGKWFSSRKWALSRFKRSDYLGSPDEPLAVSIKNKMRELTGQPVTGKVYGLMNLRTLGLYFSPVNFYYGYNDAGTCSHFLAEVSNIPWNQRHLYCHFIADGMLQPCHKKQFHVSPFNPSSQQYRWFIEPPDDNISVSLEVDDERGHVFEAHLRLDRSPLNLSSVRKQLLRNPAMTIFIVVGIYWQALKLYFKGIPYVPYEKEKT